jgi:hypothetical protein
VKTSTEHKYLLVNTLCDCHPETCCCAAYQVTCGGTVVARGNDYDRLIKLVNRANLGWKK